MTIETTFRLKHPMGYEILLHVNGSAFAENWCAEYNDWDIVHISIAKIEDIDGDEWPQSLFSEKQIGTMKLALLVEARKRSAMNPKLAVNLREMLALPEFQPNRDWVI